MKGRRDWDHNKLNITLFNFRKTEDGQYSSSWKEGEIEANKRNTTLFNFRKTKDGQYSSRWKEGEIETTTNGIQPYLTSVKRRTDSTAQDERKERLRPQQTEYKLFNFRKTEDGQYSLRWKEGDIEATTNGI